MSRFISPVNNTNIDYILIFNKSYFMLTSLDIDSKYFFLIVFKEAYFLFRNSGHILMSLDFLVLWSIRTTLSTPYQISDIEEEDRLWQFFPTIRFN